jgi:DNA-binding transcriptional ArsR family regulator
MHPKKELFTPDLQELAHWSKLLSHPARLAIVRLLAQKSQCISGDIASELPLSRATVSQHLQALKQAGLIQGEVDGLHVNYCLNVAVWKHVKATFETFLAMPVKTFPCDC